MNLVESKQLEKHLKEEAKHNKTNQDATNLFLNHFNKYKLKENLTNKDEDMMLIQYGNYNYHDGNGKEFSFDLTRQFKLLKEEEYYQLGLTLFYDYNNIQEIEPFSSWSVETNDLDEWYQVIINSEGYKNSKILTPKRYTITLDTT